MPRIWSLFPIGSDPQKLYDEVAAHARDAGGELEELYFHTKKSEAYALVRVQAEDPAQADKLKRALKATSAEVLLSFEEKKRRG